MLEGAEGSALVGNSILLGPCEHRRVCIGRKFELGATGALRVSIQPVAHTAYRVQRL
jgi:hypothetical protein